MTSNVFVEAILMGIYLVIIGYIIGWLTKPVLGVSLPEVCSRWNDNYIMETNLFLIGFFGHLILELVGVNKWYCANGSACHSVNTVAVASNPNNGHRDWKNMIFGSNYPQNKTNYQANVNAKRNQLAQKAANQTAAFQSCVQNYMNQNPTVTPTSQVIVVPSQNIASQNMASQNLASQNLASQNLMAQNIAAQNAAKKNWSSNANVNAGLMNLSPESPVRSSCRSVQGY
jgi:hypothetical protein